VSTDIYIYIYIFILVNLTAMHKFRVKMVLDSLPELVIFENVTGFPIQLLLDMVSHLLVMLVAMLSVAASCYLVECFCYV
jgi:hypothetical protein